ncbi:hypothetical protein ATK78_1644 [Pedobacter metabolipauper]|uniref:Uncharacterized protein n=1 Tax=Pedobacter metabolipauper TaxID=425513 RepID=A0A4R6SVU8_9SPHI|nr:hypothetical protein ATK78_1644 [Pedobacter metabolipauper]
MAVNQEKGGFALTNLHKKRTDLEDFKDVLRLVVADNPNFEPAILRKYEELTISYNIDFETPCLVKFVGVIYEIGLMLEAVAADCLFIIRDIAIVVLAKAKTFAVFRLFNT